MNIQTLPLACARNLKLALARAAWAVLVSLSLGLFIAAIPARHQELVGISSRVRNMIQSLPEAEQRALPLPAHILDFYAGGILGLEIAVIGVFCFTAAVLIWRKSDDWLAVFVSFAHVTYAVYITPPLDALMAAQPAWRTLITFVQAVGVGSAILFFYVLPDGRLIPRWTRWAASLWIPFTLAWGLSPDAPFNLARPFDLPLLWFLNFMVWWLTGLLAQMGRYRRASGPVQRRQTRWIIFCCAAGILVYGVVYAFGVVLPAFSELSAVNVLFVLFGAPLFPLFVVPIPLSIAFAALRYRLFDIDFFLNRALVYGLLTAALASIYFGSVVALQILFRAFVPFFQSRAAGPISPLIIAISTLAVAALFSPVRRRAQDFIDRRFFRRRYDAAQTLAAFGAAARDEVNLAQLIERLEAVVREVFQPAHISTWLSVPGGFSVRLSEIGAARERTVANGDLLAGYLRSAAGAVELDGLAFESAALRDLRRANVKVAAPFVSRSELIGWLGLGPRRSDDAYSADDLRLLTALAAQAASAVRVAQNARQQQAEAVERERLDQEMRLAGQVQCALLPGTLPEIPGWATAAFYNPARTVGGDFYDFLRFDDGQLGLVIGDVTGKGIPAALMMASARSLLRAVARAELSPNAVLRQVNELLCPDMPPGMFVTCLYAILDPVSGRLRLANAGHNLPLQQTAHGVEAVRATGMPLGLLPEQGYAETETRLAPGDCLLLYSDGLTEARNERGEMFGFARARTFVEAHRGGCPELMSGLRAELAAFTGADHEQDDDVTLFALRRTQ